jgi:hypothetical protein
MIAVCFFLLSLAYQSSVEQLARSLIYSRHFDVNRPMDLNTLLFCAWMMSEGCSYESSSPVVVPGRVLSCALMQIFDPTIY